jgi:hypothetical protein
MFTAIRGLRLAVQTIDYDSEFVDRQKDDDAELQPQVEEAWAGVGMVGCEPP